MATYGITIYTKYDSGNRTTSFKYTSIDTQETLSLEQGDTINFFHQHEGSFCPNVDVRTWGTQYWTNPTSLILNELSGSSSGSRTLRTDAPIVTGANLDINVDNSYGDIDLKLNISAPAADDYPSSFSLGSNVSGAAPASYVYFPRVKLEGIDSGVTIDAQVTGTGAQYKVGKNGTWRNVGYLTGVELGDYIYVRATANSSYGGSKSIRLYLGTRYDSVTITTMQNPDNGTKIFMPAGQVSLNSVKSFFGGPQAPNNLKSYYKGGAYVPNITENSSIASNGALSLASFSGAATSFYFATIPGTMFEDYDSTQGTGTVYLSISNSSDFSLGYGPGMSNAAQWKMAFVERTADGDGSGTDVVFSDSGVGSWSTTNDHINIEVYVNRTKECLYKGKIRLYARNPIDTNVEIYVDIIYNILIFGV